MGIYTKREKIKSIKVFEECVGRTFSVLPLSPNQWTFLALVFAFSAAYFVLQQQFILGGIFIIISGFIDFVDGAVARRLKKVTVVGAYLDTIIDRYVEFIFIFPLIFIPLPSFYLPANFWVMLYLFGGMMTTYTKAAAKEKNLRKEELKGGVLERSERIVLLTIGIFLAAINIIYLMYVIVLLSILTNVSAFQRISLALSKAEQR